MKNSIRRLLKLLRNKFKIQFYHNKINKGKDNTIHWGKNVRLRYCHITVHGKNNKILLGDQCNMRGLYILIEGNGNTIEFGKGVVINASSVQPTVINALGGTSITIGNGSLLSKNIEIHSSDYHGIYNKDGKRINPDKSIKIGDYVWIGFGCKVLKGTIISDRSVIGAGSVVSGIFNEENVIVAGNPAMIIKHQIFWEHERKDSFLVPEILKDKWVE